MFSSKGFSTASKVTVVLPSETAAQVQSQRLPLSWGRMFGSVMSATLQETVRTGNCSFMSA